MRLRGGRTSANRIENVAANWILRRDAGLTFDEEAEFQRWLAEDPRHAEAVSRKAKAWNALDRPLLSGQSAWLLARLEARAGKRRRFRATAAGAVMVMAVVVFLQANWFRPAPLDARGVVILPERRSLPDGSAVDLRPGADIAIEFGDKARRVILIRGEAHFQVATDVGRPFVVQAREVEFRAVGTAFSVQLGSESVDVLVTEGSVAVEKPASESPAQTAAVWERERGTGAAAPAAPAGGGLHRTIATIDVGKRLVVDLIPRRSAVPPVPTALTPSEVAERLAWREPRLEFSELPLREAVALMNHYNATQFVIQDAALARLPVSGIFRAGNIDTFVRLLEATCGIHAERSGETIVLKRARG